MQVLVTMVKNITIKDEAFEYLKAKKGDRSYSDIILAKKKREIKEPAAVYGETMIPISIETKELLDSNKENGESYDAVLAKKFRIPSKSYLALKKFAATTNSNDWNDDQTGMLNKDFEKRREEYDRN